MPTDWIETGYAALVAAFKNGPLGTSNPPIVRTANLIAYDGPNPFPDARVRAPDQAVRLILDLGTFTDVGGLGTMPTMCGADGPVFDSFSQVYIVKIIGPDKRSKPVTAAVAALRACLTTQYLTLPRGGIRGPLSLAPMPANSSEFDNGGLRGMAGSVTLNFNMPLSVE